MEGEREGSPSFRWRRDNQAAISSCLLLILVLSATMHLFDTLVNAPVAISSAVLSAAALGYACYRVPQTLPKDRTPMLGLSAAFIFAAQMLNFPIVGGASGHLLGAALAAVLLGPAGAIIAMTSVVVLQCLMFADGGLSALGANVFNMAVVGVLIGYPVYRAALKLLGTAKAPLAAGISAWCSVVVASAVCGGQMALSRVASPALLIGGMVGIHAIIGVGEAIITGMVVAALAKSRPDLLSLEQKAPVRGQFTSVLVFGLLLSLGLAMFVSPFACPWPDGMETVVSRLGVDPETVEPIWSGIMPDYQWELVSSEIWSTASAGAVGTIATFIIAWALVRILAMRRSGAVQPATAAADSSLNR